ncbi:proline and serine-rich protein 2 [Mugil cephalus]|uniref:proline and serine-rich protein 2 n=1 Tax=Mugil cephalus TaxID=48193 RepID=UPI001FB61BDE|nr:proline and serine-rich protein 2 [Mugil cephalus]
MDVRLHSNSQLHYNGGPGQNSRTGGDNSVPPFLSQDVQECLQFFEDTIDSLEENLEEEGKQRPAKVAPLESRSCPVTEAGGPGALSPGPGATGSCFLQRTPSPKDQDIIDLVRPEPDLVQNKGPLFSPTNPDFQNMLPYPESHFEIKPKHDQVDGLPSEYNPPLPGGYGAADGHSYHPPGCIPTPVLIAQKIAENQAGSTSSGLRRSSLESEKPLNHSPDHSVKHGPPTSAKPTRFPANINLIRGNKEPQNQSLANVNINERRAQMLANLSGSSQPLLLHETPGEEYRAPRNVPTRSISFRDPTPDVSRREALSKLGLTRNRNMSGDASQAAPAKSSSLDRVTGRDASLSPKTERSANFSPGVNLAPPPSYADRKPEVLHTDRNLQLSPSPTPVPHSSYYPPPPSSPQPEVTSLEFNNYGGKSILVHPSSLPKSEPPTSPTKPDPKTLPPALSTPSEFNTYGGKTKVMTPHPSAPTRSDLPDILSSHIDKGQSLPVKTEPPPNDKTIYGVKSLTINPSSRTKTLKPPAPATAPRPPRHSYHGATSSQMAAASAPRALSPDRRRRSNSMFRPQGITVQFSGRGATNESRRDALRKLGLLKDS